MELTVSLDVTAVISAVGFPSGVQDFSPDARIHHLELC